MNNWFIFWFLRIFLLGILIFKGLTARSLYKSFGVKRLISPTYLTYRPIGVQISMKNIYIYIYTVYIYSFIVRKVKVLLMLCIKVTSVPSVIPLDISYIFLCCTHFHTHTRTHTHAHTHNTGLQKRTPLKFSLLRCGVLSSRNRFVSC
jgi:hypothetical protein